MPRFGNGPQQAVGVSERFFKMLTISGKAQMPVGPLNGCHNIPFFPRPEVQVIRLFRADGYFTMPCFNSALRSVKLHHYSYGCYHCQPCLDQFHITTLAVIRQTFFVESPGILI
jgi:hypothetical protein